MLRFTNNPSNEAGTTEASHLLATISARIAEAGKSFDTDAAKLAELRSRLASGRFHLAVLGQFKRGKSTLLNALLGEPILPTGVVPITMAPTWIEAGPDRRVVIQMADRREERSAATASELSEFLGRYISETNNPHNAAGVKRVEVFHPAPILKAGVVLIDTPGIGSTLRHNTETTFEFLPQCDAALFVLSADPPITETEIAFLRMVQPLVSRLFFALNKIDYLDEVDVQPSIEFLRRVLMEQAGVSADTAIFPVSARMGLKARESGNSAGWQSSGMEALGYHLSNFLAAEKAEALRETVSRRASAIIADVVMRLRLAVRALEMPLDDLRSRTESLGRTAASMQRERIETVDLLAGEKRRMIAALEEQYEGLRQRAEPQLITAVATALSAIDPQRLGNAALHAALEETIRTIFEKEFKDTYRRFHQQLADTLEAHRQRTERLVANLRAAAAELFNVAYAPAADTLCLPRHREPYWKTYYWEESFGPIPSTAFDRLLPARWKRSRIDRRARRQISMLVTINAGKLRETLSEQIEYAFAQFSRELDQQLTAAVEDTRGAIAAMLAKREVHSMDAERETAQAMDTIRSLERIECDLKSARS